MKHSAEETRLIVLSLFTRIDWIKNWIFNRQNNSREDTLFSTYAEEVFQIIELLKRYKKWDHDAELKYHETVKTAKAYVKDAN